VTCQGSSQTLGLAEIAFISCGTDRVDGRVPKTERGTSSSPDVVATCDDP
jgi:hypothetical protein